MEIDMTVPETDNSDTPRLNLADDPYVADLLQVADSRIAEVEKDMQAFKDEKDVMERKLKNFKQQVRNSYIKIL